MEEEPLKEEGEERATVNTEKNQREDEKVLPGDMNRKEKRKALKKMKRKQMRKEMAAKEREEEEARLNDPEEQRRMLLMEQEEAERIERERKEFEERERAWIEAMEMKMKKAEEEEQRKLLEETHKEEQEKENELNQDDEWDYVEEGPPEIIWQGNEIIFKKKKVRVPKKDSGHQNKKEDADRPTSNPLPPESEVFADYKNSSTISVQQVLENVAQQVPNFGTEQDKAHCPFHLKTGACRFGQRCSRVHFYPDKSSTLLIKNMYSGPGLAWEQDEGLEYTDEEVERCFEEFYEDVHTEFLKFGEIVNFKVCKNGSFHLRGNVYVQYESLDSALVAYNSINGRYFAGKQVRCEFVNVTRWKVAICGEYMKSGFKTCSHGTACNFIHCFRNPGGDYEWADFDKPPPKYWIKNMAALFGSSDDHEKLTERETLSVLKNSSKKLKTDSDRYHSRRSRYREMDCFDSSGYGRRKLEHERKRSRPPDEEICELNTKLKDNHKRKGRTSDADSDTEWLDEEGNRDKRRKRSRKSSTNRNKDDERRSGYGRRKQNKPDEEICEQNTNLKDNHKRKDRTSDTDFDTEWLEEEGDREKQRKHTSKSSTSRNKDDERRSHEEDSDVDWAAIPGDREKQHGSDGRNSRQRNRDIDEAGPDGDCSDRDRDRKRHHTCKRKKSSHRSRDYRNLNSEIESDRSFFDGDGDMETHNYSSRKSSKHRRSGFPDDYKDYENRNDEDRRSHHHDAKSSSKHKKKLEYFDDHGDECKSRLQERVV